LIDAIKIIFLNKLIIMSESQTPVNTDNTNQKSGNSFKSSIISSVITLISAALVAWIGVLPQLQKKDQTVIKELQDKVNQLVNQKQSKCKITGNILQKDGKAFKEAQIFVAKNNDNAYPDDQGQFFIENLDHETYSLVVFDKTNNNSYRMLIGESQSQNNLAADLYNINVTYKNN
jgi:lipopolysaccharide export LptBFGC system permease protein LptF